MKKLILSLVTITFLSTGLMLQTAQAAKGNKGNKGNRKGDVEQTISGTAVCTKCQLHETAECGLAVKVAGRGKKAGTETVVYLAKNDVTKALEGKVCEAGKPVTVTGTEKREGGKGGKMVMTATKIEEGKTKAKGKGRKKA